MSSKAHRAMPIGLGGIHRDWNSLGGNCGLSVKCPHEVCVFELLVSSWGEVFGMVVEPLGDGVF